MLASGIESLPPFSRVDRVKMVMSTRILLIISYGGSLMLGSKEVHSVIIRELSCLLQNPPRIFYTLLRTGFKILKKHNVQSQCSWFLDTKAKDTNKENEGPILYINTDEKILNKTVANQIQQHVKRIMHHDKVRHILGKQGRFNTQKSTNGAYHINRRKGRKPDTEKAFDKTQPPFITK